MFLGHPFGSMSHESRQGLVSVAITLRPAAAEVGMRLCRKFTDLTSDFEETMISSDPR